MSYPKYDLNKFIRSGIDRADYIKSLINFIKPALISFNTLEHKCMVDRIRATLVQEEYYCDFNDVAKAIDEDISIEKELINRVGAYKKCEKYIEQRVGTIDLPKLKKAHEILLRQSNQEKYGGILRNQDDLVEDGTHDLLQRLITFSNQKKTQHPIIHALSVYLMFDIVQPFIVQNQALSLIYFNAIVNHYNKDLGAVLGFEKFMLKDWNTHKSIKLNSLFPLNPKERLEEDQTAFFENCFTLLIDSFAETEELLIENLKKSIKYSELPPIAKNSFNYFFEMGFKKHYKSILALNDRQQAILRDVVFGRNVTTKQMVMKYRCDRKTVQRDFADLMEIGIVSFEGKTKTVNYHLSFA